MNQSNGNARGLNGLLEGKQSLDQQIEQSLAAAQEAMDTLRVAMAFKHDLDAAVVKFQQGMCRKDEGGRVKDDSEDQTVDEILADYQQRKSRL